LGPIPNPQNPKPKTQNPKLIITDKVYLKKNNFINKKNFF